MGRTKKVIRKIREEDKAVYFDMARDFYSSDAVFRNVPQLHFTDAFNELMRSDEYAEGYIIEYGHITAGYALIAKTFSQEAGGKVIWLDELYIKKEYRGKGLGHEFFRFLEKSFSGEIKRIRLEVDYTNEKARLLYNRLGFEPLPYSQMFMDL